MKRALRDQLHEFAGGSVLYYFEGFDEAIVGVAQQHTKAPAVVYDRSIVISLIMRQMDCDEDEAWAYAQEHLFSEWRGMMTPMFLDTPIETEDE